MHSQKLWIFSTLINTLLPDQNSEMQMKIICVKPVIILNIESTQLIIRCYLLPTVLSLHLRPEEVNFPMMIFLSLALGERWWWHSVLDQTAYNWHFRCAAWYLIRHKNFCLFSFLVGIQHQLADFYCGETRGGQTTFPWIGFIDMNANASQSHTERLFQVGGSSLVSLKSSVLSWTWLYSQPQGGYCRYAVSLAPLVCLKRSKKWFCSDNCSLAGSQLA